MARKNVVDVTTNVTPDQLKAIDQLCKVFGVGRAQLTRMALAQYVERNDVEWPTAEIIHGRRKSESVVNTA